MKKIISIISGKANLIKAEPVDKAIRNLGFNHIIIDFGVNKSAHGNLIYSELGISSPQYLYENSSQDKEYLSQIKSQAFWAQNIINIEKPDLVIVYGDLNGSVAGVFAAKMSYAYVIHIEAGLRNHDVFDTEELNRIIIDNMSNILVPPSNLAMECLINEKLNNKPIILCGNTIIDCLKRHINNILSKYTENQLPTSDFVLVTIHREENLNSSIKLTQIELAIKTISEEAKVIFIQYSNTKKSFRRMAIQELQNHTNLHIVDTLSYYQYLSLLLKCKLILTDSSSMVDEATYLGKKCIIVRGASHRLGAMESKNNTLTPAIATEIIKVYNVVNNSKRIIQSYPKEWDYDFVTNFKKLLLNDEICKINV